MENRKLSLSLSQIKENVMHKIYILYVFMSVLFCCYVQPRQCCEGTRTRTPSMSHSASQHSLPTDGATAASILWYSILFCLAKMFFEQKFSAADNTLLLYTFHQLCKNNQCCLNDVTLMPVSYMHPTLAVENCPIFYVP